MPESAAVGLLRNRASGACPALIALALTLALPAGAAADYHSADAGSLSPLARGVVSALAQSPAGHALDTLGSGLALLEARKRIERQEAAAAKAEAAEEAVAKQASFEEVKDPSEMPAASAGSNGSYKPGSAPGASKADGEMFAHSRAIDPGDSSAILLSGIALAPPDAPAEVKAVINNANMIVGQPYVWGGGHGSWYSNGYDCSGAVSFALFGGGLIPEPLTSGALEGWGAPGPGKWITVYANGGHTFAEIAGLRWDTVGDANGSGPRWHLAPNSSAGFVVRHPPGL
jgi:cell wall-associated NlpC family hydrolase